jgi:acetyltransferase-like isoleucine patch superfamily enzyme
MSPRQVRLALFNSLDRAISAAFLGLRFFNRPIHIHHSSRVSMRSIISVANGGSITIGKNCDIHPYAMLLAQGGDIRIGDHCSVNPFTIIYGLGGTSIGNGVRIAAHCVIVPENHNRGSDAVPLYKSGSSKIGIIVEDNVWIGSGVRVLDGVRIGRNSVIGAGSVVTRSVPPDSTAVGVPARPTAVPAEHTSSDAMTKVSP